VPQLNILNDCIGNVKTLILVNLRWQIVRDASLSPDAGEESEKAEDDEWESQQIRKGVTGAQVCWCSHQQSVLSFSVSL
jgi:hypothetical protein